MFSGHGVIATGAVLRAISWRYKHREIFRAGWNMAKSGAKWLGNKVKGWFFS